MTETHRHYWTTTDDAWTCTDCEETCPQCVEGEHPTGTAQLICEKCIIRWRRTLDDIATATSWYRWAPPSRIHATRYDRDIVRGSQSDDPRPRITIRDLPEIITSWRNMWASAWDDGATTRTHPIDWLKGRIMWAASNPQASDWDDFKTEMRHALYVAKRDAGLLPKRMPAPCAHCGGVVVRTWADKDLTPHGDGISDLVQCLGCSLTWASEEHYRQLSKHHLRALPEVRPETLVTAKEAMTIWPDVPEATWRKWASRGEMPDPAGWTERGVPQYRVGDLAALPERRQSEGRQGRKATA